VLFDLGNVMDAKPIQIRMFLYVGVFRKPCTYFVPWKCFQRPTH
jgi:hypothetical protein